MSKSATLQSFCMYLKKLCITEADNDKYIYCFRGHKSRSFEYKPSLLRNDGFLKNEEIIKDEVITHYPEFFHEHGKINNEDIATMQHYGIPTRLLDVTFNPFIAMFFATEPVPRSEKIDMSGEVAVFKVPIEFVKYFDTADPRNDSTKPMLLRTILNNPRIKQQNGAFFEFSKAVKEIPNDWIVTKIEIENSAKKNLRAELEIMNISKSTIYPELENFKSEIERKYKS